MKEKLVKAALVVGSISFCVLAIEVSLRAYHGEWGYINFRDPTGAWLGAEQPFAFDPELGWVPKQGVWSKGDLTILRDGIRSNGPDKIRDASEPILAIGDSFTFGLQVSDWETWPAQLEELSGRSVINGGSPGYGIDQAFLRARRLLNRYRISTVIFSFIPDDIRRSQMVKFFAAKPYFDFEDGRLTLENVPVPPPPRPPKKSELLILLEHSRLVHAVMKRLFPNWWQGSMV